MSKTQTLRVLINQRLSLAAAEIFELFERSIAEYEEQLCRSKEENQRQQKLLEAVYSPEVRLHRTDVQQLVVSKDELHPEQQDRKQDLEQEESEPPLIKKEEEEPWSRQEEEQLHEREEENPQSLQLLQKQNEENKDLFEGPGLIRNSDPETQNQSGDSAEPETEVFNVHQQIEEAQFLFNFPRNDRNGCNVKLFPCAQCGKQFNQNSNLKTHMRIHTGEKPFSCSFCGQRFAQKVHLQSHQKRHTGEKPYRCSLCGKCFTRFAHLRLHMRTHTGEKPFTCNFCSRRFTWLYQFKKHKCGGGTSQFCEMRSINPDYGEKVQSSQLNYTAGSYTT